MYILQKEVSTVKRLFDNAFIPFDPANTDFQQFKANVLAGTELHNSDGEVMTAEEALAFIKELP